MSVTTAPPILTVRNLSASIAGQQVVESVSFEVPATGITAVLGRNGVGKTSTIRAILGLIHRRGEVTLAGERIDGLPTHRIVQRGVGYVPEDREVFAGLTVAENLALAERDKNPRREFVAELFPTSSRDAPRRPGPCRAVSSRWSPWPARSSTRTRSSWSTNPRRAWPRRSSARSRMRWKRHPRSSPSSPSSRTSMSSGASRRAPW